MTVLGMDILNSKNKPSSAELLTQTDSASSISINASTSGAATQSSPQLQHQTLQRLADLTTKSRTYQTYSICNVIIFTFTLVLVSIQLGILLKNQTTVPLTVQAMAALSPALLVVTIAALIVSIKSRQAFSKGFLDLAAKHAKQSLILNLIADLVLCMSIIYIKILD
jgi:hypothetical protein